LLHICNHFAPRAAPDLSVTSHFWQPHAQFSRSTLDSHYEFIIQCRQNISPSLGERFYAAAAVSPCEQ
jgi:hypothetical protein